MLDHISLTVLDLQKSKAFYQKVFEPLKFKTWVDQESFAGFGNEDRPYFWLNKGSTQNKVHIAFQAKDRKTVDQFYVAAIAAGAKDHGKPGLRPEYHENYYGAFVIDIDGNNIEAICHRAE